jgi:hypothetical protein
MSNIARVFKKSDSYATRVLPEPMASLREYTACFFVTTFVESLNYKRVGQPSHQ